MGSGLYFKSSFQVQFEKPYNGVGGQVVETETGFIEGLDVEYEIGVKNYFSSNAQGFLSPCILNTQCYPPF